MVTRNEQTPNDCYTSALDDEPTFTLLARDPSAPAVVTKWAEARLHLIVTGQKPETDLPKVIEALNCALRMDMWRIKNDGIWRQQGNFNLAVARNAVLDSATGTELDKIGAMRNVKRFDYALRENNYKVTWETDDNYRKRIALARDNEALKPIFDDAERIEPGILRAVGTNLDAIGARHAIYRQSANAPWAEPDTTYRKRIVEVLNKDFKRNGVVVDRFTVSVGSVTVEGNGPIAERMRQDINAERGNDPLPPKMQQNPLMPPPPPVPDNGVSRDTTERF